MSLLSDEQPGNSVKTLKKAKDKSNMLKILLFLAVGVFKAEENFHTKRLKLLSIKAEEFKC